MSATTEEDKHFSDSMLQWMAEGDRLHEDPKHGGFSAEGTPRRSWKLWVAAAWAVALVIGGRFALQHMGADTAPVAEAASAPAVASSSVPVAAAPPAPVVPAATTAPAAQEAIPAPQPNAAVAAAPAQAKPAIEVRATEALAAVAAEEKPPTAVHQETPPPAEAVQPQPAPAKAQAPAPTPIAAAAPAPAPVVAAAAAPVAAPAEAPTVEDFDTLLSRCRESTARGRWGAARTACTAAQQARPDSPDVLTRLAEIALNRGQGRAALRFANAALAADPAFADAYVIVGSVQQNENRNVEARAAYSQYLKLAPAGRYASDLRAIISTL